MTPSEYIQLKAFARQDGVWLALLWTVSFGCYVAGFSNPVYGLTSVLLVVVTPFFAGRRLRRFRDEDLGGVISLMRGWAFVILMFFYAAILLALAQYVYFAYIDQGFLLASFTKVLSSPENHVIIEQMGFEKTIEESVGLMSTMRPIDFALNVLTVNIAFGIVLGLPIAALKVKDGKNVQGGEKNNVS